MSTWLKATKRDSDDETVCSPTTNQISQSSYNRSGPYISVRISITFEYVANLIRNGNRRDIATDFRVTRNFPVISSERSRKLRGSPCMARVIRTKDPNEMFILRCVYVERSARTHVSREIFEHLETHPNCIRVRGEFGRK